tara:strand:- start:179 stop:766 length:588 start_codon:yes stop_codon:yes gene_type:complete
MNPEEFMAFLESSTDTIRKFRKTHFPLLPGITYVQAAELDLISEGSGYRPCFSPNLIRANENFARQLFELAMLKGERSFWLEARSLEENIGPSTNTEIYGFLEPNENGFPCLHGHLRNEIDEFEWQLWRHQSFVNGDYQADLFPTYNCGDVVGDEFHANKRFEGDVYIYESMFSVNPNPRLLPGDQEFRFIYLIR